MLYFIGLIAAMTNAEREGLATAIALLTGAGMMAVGFQNPAAYPLIESVLLVLAYRYVGIPARAPE